jgi:hypothetical protein
LLSLLKNCLALRNSRDCSADVRLVKENDELQRSQADKPLKLSSERARKQVLDLLKHARTCKLALELCFLVRTHRAVLGKQDVHDCCNFVSELCKEAGCLEASELCAKAAEVVLGSEKTYLELCEQSLKKCSASRQPTGRSSERTTYVA